MAPVTTIVNDTPFQIRINSEWYYDTKVPRGAPIIIPEAGGKRNIQIDPHATYREYSVQSSRDSFSSMTIDFLNPDDFYEWEEIRIYLKGDILSWEGSVRRRTAKDFAGLESAKNKVSSKFDAAPGSFVNLKDLLKAVKICHNQCNHLVQTYEEGIQKTKQLYSRVIKDELIWDLYNAEKLTQLYNSLDKLEYVLCDANNLLQACAKELGKIALVVSMPTPPVNDMEVCSKFDLLVNELMWNLDSIEHALHPAGAVMFEWCPDMRRYVLKRTDGGMTIAAEMKPHLLEGVHSRALLDCKDLQSGLEDGSVVIPDTTNLHGISLFTPILQLCNSSTVFNHFARLFLRPDQKILNEIIIERCKVKMDPESQLSMSLGCLKISNPLDLQTTKVLGGGSFKDTYEGEWCGRRMVIAKFKRNFDYDKLEKEVKQLVCLQHPKVVSFFGWAYTDDALAPVKTDDDNDDDDDGSECQELGYIVTEKMERDLQKLIQRIRKAATIQRDSGGPFSHSVGLDILLQIVEAMLHVQKHGVMHRDLKPENVLVNPRSSPARPDADTYYDVKLIDFGSSKLMEESNDKGQTYNKGTGRYGAPEMMVGTVGWGKRGDYDPSGLDAFGFAMTCYTVVTGLEPFHDTKYFRIVQEKLETGERPQIPETILLRPGLKELMADCWAREPTSRPNFKEIQERLWTIRKELEVPSDRYL